MRDDDQPTLPADGPAHREMARLEVERARNAPPRPHQAPRARKAEPPPLPGGRARRSEAPTGAAAREEPGEPRALSPGTLVVPVAGEPRAAAAPPADCPADAAPVSVEPDEEPPPSSTGTPALSALTASLQPRPPDHREDESLWLGESIGTERVAPPTIGWEGLAGEQQEPQPVGERAEAERVGGPLARRERSPGGAARGRRGTAAGLLIFVAAVGGVFWAAHREPAEDAVTSEPIEGLPPAAIPAPEPKARVDREDGVEEPAPPASEGHEDEAARPSVRSTEIAVHPAPAPSPPASGRPASTEGPGDTAREEQAARPGPTDPRGAPAVVSAAGKTETAQQPAEPSPFDRAAAAAAVAALAQEASACRKEQDPTGRAEVAVTFAPSGRATRAVISGPPFAGTPTGSCIATTLRRARVPPFEGDFVTVQKSLVIY